jgi:hypothetical protein
VVFCLAFGPVADAAMVQKMDLGEVCSRAANIFRGTVLSEVPGTVEAGGATLPTVTYTVKVSEAFQGDFQTKGDQQYAEITMLGSVKPVQVGGQRSFPALADMPRLDVGKDYLLMTSSPSAIGLSAPIGLAQGCYAIQGKGENQTAVNELGETFNYQAMASAIRAAVAQ